MIHAELSKKTVKLDGDAEDIAAEIAMTIYTFMCEVAKSEGEELALKFLEGQYNGAKEAFDQWRAENKALDVFEAWMEKEGKNWLNG